MDTRTRARPAAARCAIALAAVLAGCGQSPPAAVTATSADDAFKYAVTADAIVVQAHSTRAVIDRGTFHVTFQDRQGRAVLDGVANDGALPQPIAAAAEPAPLGGELPKSPSLYAPLAFVVGAQQAPQIPAGPWEANLLTGTAAGVAFHATTVNGLDTRAPDHLELTLGTNDPSGRTIALTVRAAGNGGLRFSARAVPDTGVAVMSDAFVAAPDDAFRGFGGRHNALDQRGNDFLGWVMQQGTGAGRLQPVADALPGGGAQYLFPNGRTQAYYVAPQFVAPRYGFLLERDELSRWRMASDRADAWQVQVASPALDYSVVAGAPPETIAALTQLTGRHRAPPAWATGVLLDRSTIPFTQSADQYAQQVRDDIAQIDARHLVVSGYRVEGWFELAPDLRRQIADALHARGIRVLAYFRSFVASDGAGTEDPAVFQQAITRGYVTTTAAGTPYLFGGNFMGPSALIDFTNADALAWWKGRIQGALDEGVDGFMQDFGEQTMTDMHFADGRTGATMHNRYSVVYHRATREAIDEWLAAHPGHDDIWFFTRAGYNGLDGAARYEGANFAGDGNTDWSVSSGLPAQTPDMLSRAVGGAYGFTTDIGGYFDFVTPATTKELFVRWAEWATLSPVMRLHGSAMAGTHMPWTFDDETVAIWKALSALRLRAQPYIQASWRAAQATGLPPVRPLWLAFPDDAQAASQMQEWMLGEDVLVAPVVSEGAVSRDVYFPAGCWQHGETGERFAGPASATVAAPLASLPYFFRCGTQPF